MFKDLSNLERFFICVVPLFFCVGTGAGGDYSKEGSVHDNEDRSGIKQTATKISLTISLQNYVGEYDLKTEGKASDVFILFYSAAYPA